jgi:hypothetical protein
MKGTTTSALRCMVFAITGAIVGLFTMPPTPAAAQVQGNNAIYSSTGSIVPSSAFIDASQFIGTGTDHSGNVCGAIYGILSGHFPSSFSATIGAVVDARGISGSTALTCPSGTTPWSNGSTTVSAPSTILLPAGTISTLSTWILPANTHLIGEGDGIPSGSSTPGTTIQAGSGFSGSTVIQFGSAVGTGITVENLTLDGQGQSINGITNEFAQNASYVNHISLYRIHGTGLLIEDSANNSGPYSNITFNAGFTPPSTTVCAQIIGVTDGTHGIHGLICATETTSYPNAAVLLDSSNNSIEDVRVEGFSDGILVGEYGNAQSNVLANISGDTPNGTTSVNVIHIANVGNTVTDLSIVGVSNVGGFGTITIKDDPTSTSLPDASVGLYALGEQANGGHSRFTTSPNAATWVSGTTAPTSSCPASASGSLYSNSSGSGGNLWVCPATTGGGAWKNIR